MTTLATSVNETDELWTVDVLPATEYVQVGSEVVRVVADFAGSTYRPTGLATPPKLRVARAQSGTTAASHTQGASITAAYIPGTGTGGEQTVRLLGPFPIAFDDADLLSSDMELVALSAGSVVIRAWAIVSERFASTPSLSSNDLHLNLGIGSAAAGTVVVTADFEFETREQPVAFALIEGIGGVAPKTFVGHVVDTGLFLCADIQNFGTALDAGAADIYALIAEPA